MKVYVVFTRYLFKNKVTGDMEVTEVCDVVDKITRKMDREASVIMDFSSNKLLKNREPEVTIEQYLEHFRNRYPKQFNGVLKLAEAEREYLSNVNEVLDSMIKEMDEKEKEKKKDEPQPSDDTTNV